jgi:hypothetical protein
MMFYCEVCRIVLHNPSDKYKDDTEIRILRKLLEHQMFAYCPICTRTQIFTMIVTET